MTNDEQIFDAMVKAARDAKRIGYVDWGLPQVTVPAEHKSSARITRKGFRCVPSNANNTDDQRIVSYEIELRVRDTDNDRLKRRVYQLECHLINLFHNRSIGGLTEPMFTLLETGSDLYSYESSSERAVKLTGQFSYTFVPGTLAEK